MSVRERGGTIQMPGTTYCYNWPPAALRPRFSQARKLEKVKFPYKEQGGSETPLVCSILHRQPIELFAQSTTP
jgi:hypothetical protein